MSGGHRLAILRRGVPVRRLARMVTVLLIGLLLPRAGIAACTPIAFGKPTVWRAVLGDPTLTITFLGHASFLIESPSGVRAVTDYGATFGPVEPPDIVTMNRAHSMHNTANPDPRIRFLLKGWQEGTIAPRHDVVLRDMRVTNLPTNLRSWSGGTEVNANSIFIFESGGLCIAHLGHLHHLLLPADLDALGRIDILMIAVDGGYTLGHQDAMELIGQIHPRVVLPMHYFSHQNLARFLSLLRGRFAIDLRDASSLQISRATLPAEPTVIALPGPH